MHCARGIPGSRQLGIKRESSDEVGSSIVSRNKLTAGATAIAAAFSSISLMSAACPPRSTGIGRGMLPANFKGESLSISSPLISFKTRTYARTGQLKTDGAIAGAMSVTVSVGPPANCQTRARVQIAKFRGP